MNEKGGVQLGILSGNNSKEPLHIGEVSGMWAHLLAANGLMRLYETFVNHAGDPDLKKELQGVIKGVQQEAEKLSEYLKENGIPLPPTTPERPVANAEEIPPGARVLDPEIANVVGANIAQGLVSCSAVMGQCTNEDIAMMFGQFHAAKAMAGAKWLRLMKEKAWVIIPPLHHHPAQPAKS